MSHERAWRLKESAAHFAGNPHVQPPTWHCCQLCYGHPFQGSSAGRVIPVEASAKVRSTTFHKKKVHIIKEHFARDTDHAPATSSSDENQASCITLVET